MTAQYMYGRSSTVSPMHSPRVARSIERAAVPASGRITALAVGMGTGFIQLSTDNKVFFHRADLQAGTSINDFRLGDPVEFDLVNDPVSGARALHVRRLPVT
jgi:cold shock CspA family protein